MKLEDNVVEIIEAALISALLYSPKKPPPFCIFFLFFRVENEGSTHTLYASFGHQKRNRKLLWGTLFKVSARSTKQETEGAKLEGNKARHLLPKRAKRVGYLGVEFTMPHSMGDGVDPTLDLPARTVSGEWSSESSDAEDSRETKSHDSNALEGVEAVVMKLELSSAVDEINQSAKARFLLMQQTQKTPSLSFEASDKLESSHLQSNSESFKYSLENSKQEAEDDSSTSSSGLSAEVSNQNSLEGSKQIAADSSSSSSELSAELPNDSSFHVTAHALPTNPANPMAQNESQLSPGGVDSSEPTFNSLFDSHTSAEAKSRAKAAVLDTSRDAETAAETTQASDTAVPRCDTDDGPEGYPTEQLNITDQSYATGSYGDINKVVEPHSIGSVSGGRVDPRADYPTKEEEGAKIWNEDAGHDVRNSEDADAVNNGDDDTTGSSDDDLERSRQSSRRGPACSSRESDGIAREWAVLNRTLEEAGLPEIELRPSDPSGNSSGNTSGWAHSVQVGGIPWLVEPGSVRKALAETLKQYNRRGQRLSELHGRPGGAAGFASPMPSAAPAVNTSNAPAGALSTSVSSARGLKAGKAGHRSGGGGNGSNVSQSQLRASRDDDDEMERAAHQEARLQRTVARLEEQLSEADAEATKLRRAMAEEARQHAAREKELKLQVKQSEHRVKVQEAQQEKLADKLRVQVRFRKLDERDASYVLLIGWRASCLSFASQALSILHYSQPCYSYLAPGGPRAGDPRARPQSFLESGPAAPAAAAGLRRPAIGHGVRLRDAAPCRGARGETTHEIHTCTRMHTFKSKFLGFEVFFA